MRFKAKTVSVPFDSDQELTPRFPRRSSSSSHDPSAAIFPPPRPSVRGDLPEYALPTLSEC